MTVRYSTMTQSLQPAVPKSKKGKKRWKLNPARATILAAFIAVVGGVAGAYIAPQNAATTPPASSVSSTSLGPATVNIQLL